MNRCSDFILQNARQVRIKFPVDLSPVHLSTCHLETKNHHVLILPKMAFAGTTCKFIWTHRIMVSILIEPNFLQTQNCFGPKTFLDQFLFVPKIFRTQNVLDQFSFWFQKCLDPYFSWTHIFLTHFFGPTLFITNTFWIQNFF